MSARCSPWARCMAAGTRCRPTGPPRSAGSSAAAERGHAYAQMMLGRYLARGLAGERDPDRARVWLERALAQGLQEARTTLPPCRRRAESEEPRRAGSRPLTEPAESRDACARGVRARPGEARRRQRGEGRGAGWNAPAVWHRTIRRWHWRWRPPASGTTTCARRPVRRDQRTKATCGRHGWAWRRRGRRLGDAAGAAEALASALRRHVPDPGFAALADAIARDAGAPGWCGLVERRCVQYACDVWCGPG